MRACARAHERVRAPACVRAYVRACVRAGGEADFCKIFLAGDQEHRLDGRRRLDSSPASIVPFIGTG
eukprot:14785631-Alexandrium_andersonii.AAC.1